MAQTQEVAAKREQILGSWRTMSPQALRSPDNAEALRGLQATAKNDKSGPARAILIRADDQQTINLCLADLHTADPLDPQRRIEAMDQFRGAANPRTIALLARDLALNESSDKITLGGIGLSPLSVASAKIIREIIMKSDAFPPAVRKWAEDLVPIDDEVRAPIRAWWNLNKAAVEAGNYQATMVPPPSH